MGRVSSCCSRRIARRLGGDLGRAIYLWRPVTIAQALLNWLRGTGMVLLLVGRVEEARQRIEQAIAAFDTSDETERKVARAAGQDAGVVGLALNSWALWALGYADRALVQMGAALDQHRGDRTSADRWPTSAITHRSCMRCGARRHRRRFSRNVV